MYVGFITEHNLLNNKLIGVIRGWGGEMWNVIYGKLCS